MPDAAKQQLIAAIQNEQDANLADSALYKALTLKMNAYQLGQGPEPSLAEFTQWNEAVKRRLALTRLNAGLTEEVIPNPPHSRRRPTAGAAGKN